AVEHELVDVAHAGREGEADAGVEIGADGRLAATARLRAVGVEPHVVDRRAAGSYMTPRAERRRQLRLEDRHERPVDQVVLEVIVEGALPGSALSPAGAVAPEGPPPSHPRCVARR